MATVTKRGDTYRITVSCGYDSTGKQIRKTSTWKPKPGMTSKQIEKELERQKVLFEERIQSGQYADGSMKLDEFIARWFRDYANKNLKPATLQNYTEFMKRVSPALGHIRMDKLRPAHLLEFYDNLSEIDAETSLTFRASDHLKKSIKGLDCSRASFCKEAGISENTMRVCMNGNAIALKSATKISETLKIPFGDLFLPSGKAHKLSGKTIGHYHRFLSAVFSTAVEWQILDSNPCERVKPPKAEKHEAQYLDETQVEVLINALEEKPLKYQVIVILLLYSGMRRGELCALSWDDISIQDQVIHVRKNAFYSSSLGYVEGTPKTVTSVRAIKLPAFIFDLLAQWKREQSVTRLKMGDRWHDTGKVFTQDNGNPINMSALSSWIKSFATSLGLPPITAHSLRHTNASLLIAGGTNIRTVSGRLGHSSPTVTGNIYSHAIKSADAAASETLELMLKKKA